ncbi:hypothetical protein FDB55_02930 [Clostridium botulinum]|uniref:Uncharacterized protein n=1 Tax=Clostridium botulinum TaxID=1491 RepID=A0A6B4RDZ7_CLOBO|nr:MULTISPECIES: hypothetical protein [Clostridium]ACD52616.1 conserved hypothetical protein [Clostridium botulinum E3 str. Alaska E43]AJF29455.1 hypothetical protein ST13_07045 [Clostridium botulinum]AJF32516.1 hypothetical protein ST12_07045 [Clostridium botulinum]KIL09688.1 hypothetical protein SR42_12100 [Clostridium botulinum]MBN1035243.1 hypothetical protein [Clostridium botulinum]
MRNINYDYNCVVFKGYLYYEDKTPVKNTIVLLEIVLSDKEKVSIKKNSNLYCAYSITNDLGEFCFKISDKNHYYKIKIFENHNIKCLDNETIFVDM